MFPGLCTATPTARTRTEMAQVTSPNEGLETNKFPFLWPLSPLELHRGWTGAHSRAGPARGGLTDGREGGGRARQVPQGRCHTGFCLLAQLRAVLRAQPPRVSEDPRSSPSPAFPLPCPPPLSRPRAPPAPPAPLSAESRSPGSSTSPFPQRSHLCARHLRGRPGLPDRIRRVFLPGRGPSARPAPLARPSE